MEKNIFLLEYFKIIYYLYQLKVTLNNLVAVLGLNQGNLMECQTEENIENITNSNDNFVSTFIDHNVLPDINFNRNRLIKIIFLSLKK